MSITDFSTAVPLLIWMAESDPGNQNAAIIKDDSGKSESDEGAKYYTEKYIGPGKLVRQCIVSEDCPNKNWHYAKRIDMVRHLKQVHDIDFDIPRLPMGRPRFCHLALSSRPQSTHRKKQITQICRKRFENVELKVKNARKKFHAGLLARATAAWQDYKKDDLSEDEFRKKFIEDKMNEWEAQMPRRVEAIKRRIEQGYDKMKRIKHDADPSLELSETFEDMTEGISPNVEDDVKPTKKTARKKTGNKGKKIKRDEKTARNKLECADKLTQLERAEKTIQHKVEYAWNNFHAELSEKAIAAWEDYSQDDLSEVEFRKNFVEEKVNEWMAQLPQRIEAIKERMEKSCVKKKWSKHDTDPDVVISETSENMNDGASPNVYTRVANNTIERSIYNATKNSVQGDQLSAEASLCLRCEGEADEHKMDASNALCQPSIESRERAEHGQPIVKVSEQGTSCCDQSNVCVNEAAETDSKRESMKHGNHRKRSKKLEIRRKTCMNKS